MRTTTEIITFSINGDPATVGKPKLKVSSGIGKIVFLQFGEESKIELSAQELITAIQRAVYGN